MEQIRAFVAIELDREIIQTLAHIRNRLQSKNRASVKWVEPESIHLTLKFLGNIDSGTVPEINTALEKSVAGIARFNLQLGGLGVFPGLERVRIVWVGLSGDVDRLKYLQQRVETGLAPLGFAPETREFSPHLTLARVRDNATPLERQDFGRLIGNMRLETGQTINVSATHLIKSQLTRTGSIYTILSTVDLK